MPPLMATGDRSHFVSPSFWLYTNVICILSFENTQETLHSVQRGVYEYSKCRYSIASTQRNNNDGLRPNDEQRRRTLADSHRY